MESCTECPSRYPINTPDGRIVYLVDAPGFGDSDVDKEYPNISSLQHIMRNSEKVSFWTLAAYDSIESKRGAGFLAFATSVARVVDKTGLNSLGELALPLLSKMKAKRLPKMGVEKGMVAMDDVIKKRIAL